MRATEVDQAAVLAAFDAQMRRHAPACGPGDRVERAGDVVRHLGAAADGWTGIVWSALDEASADAAIAAEVRHFAALGRTFEWKHYAHDLPADLPRRLVAAGFEPEPAEALMVAEIASLPAGAPLPPGVRLVEAHNDAGVALAATVHGAVFGDDHGWFRREMATRIADGTVAVVVAMAGDLPVSAARVDLYPGKDFAGLYGGGTLPAFRGRGIYRALVAHRAALAAARGFRYLQVDALPTSRPILERLGFVQLTTTTPFVRPPG